MTNINWFESCHAPIEVGGRAISVHPAHDTVMVVAQRRALDASPEATKTISILLDRENASQYLRSILDAARVTWPDFTLEEIT